MQMPTSVPGAVQFVLSELAKFGKSKGHHAQRLADRFRTTFTAKHPELIKPGDDDAPEPPDAASIDGDIDVAIEDGTIGES